MAGFEQQRGGRRADVAGAAGQKEVHRMRDIRWMVRRERPTQG